MAEIAALQKIDGRTRLAKRRKADAARRQEIAQGLLNDLNRPVNTTDREWARHLAGLLWRAEYLESIGQDATEARRLINQATRAGGVLKPSPPGPPQGPTSDDIWDEYLSSDVSAEATA
jgi:hypothetical protein